MSAAWKPLQGTNTPPILLHSAFIQSHLTIVIYIGAFVWHFSKLVDTCNNITHMTRMEAAGPLFLHKAWHHLLFLFAGQCVDKD
jgi:hypothetical protein